jgi:hypothetical protein
LTTFKNSSKGRGKWVSMLFTLKHGTYWQPNFGIGICAEVQQD